MGLRGEAFQSTLEFVEELVGDALLNQQTGAGAADVTLVEEDAVDDALDRLIEWRIVEHDVRGFAAELQAEMLPGPRQCRWISLPTSVEPVNAILSTPGCATSAAPLRRPPVMMLTTPGGSSACSRSRRTSAR